MLSEELLGFHNRVSVFEMNEVANYWDLCYHKPIAYTYEYDE